jgi:hypothetical protein
LSYDGTLASVEPDTRSKTGACDVEIPRPQAGSFFPVIPGLTRLRLPGLKCTVFACMPVKAHRRIPRIRKGRRVDVRRDEFNELVDLLNERGKLLNVLIEEQKIQFERIAQIQAQLDLLKREWARLKSGP